MTATTGWAAGRLAGAYTSAGFTATDFNSLGGSGSTVVASTAIDNSTALDLYAEISFIMTIGGTTTGTSVANLYILPLNRDGTTYGDGTANGSTAPAAQYLAATVNVLSGVTTGNTIKGTFPRVEIPRGAFKLAFENRFGIALNATASATVEYRTANINLNA